MKIFLSHASEDKELADQIHLALVGVGHKVFFDRESLPPGGDYYARIHSAVKSSDLFVFLISPHSVAPGRYTLTELKYARDRWPHPKGRVLPVRLQAVSWDMIPTYLKAVTVLEPEGNVPAEVVGAVAKMVPLMGFEERTTSEVQTKSDEVSSSSARERTRKITVPVLVALIGIVVALGAAAYKLFWSPRSAGHVFRDSLKSGGAGPEMVVIEAGSFQMGGAPPGYFNVDELPVHFVRIEKPFAIGRYEVTFADYDQFAKATGRDVPFDEGWGKDSRPVIRVSWEDAVSYTLWLSEKTGKRYRLPAEAEWEYAARGGKASAYWWDKDLIKGKANCNGCGSEWDNKQTAPVGSFEANPFGIYDTAGNVYEWVADCYHQDYRGAPTDGSAWKEANCNQRVIRGGSWADSPLFIRSSARLWNTGVPPFNSIGFRLARDID
jgi:formylglycine-generating enzyme required for sulfatase activity